MVKTHLVCLFIGLVLVGSVFFPVPTHAGARVKPSSLSFSSQAVGTISSAKFATFTNIGSSTINFGTETISGDFTWGGLGTCGSSLAVGGNCTMSIKFKPTATGTRTGSLTVNDNVSGTPQVVALTGTGTTATSGSATVKVSPTSLSFGSQAVGTVSSVQFVTFTNSGSSTINFGTETISGDFTWGGLGTCGSSLAVGGSCTMSVKFKPTATGTRTGSLTVNDNASGSPQVVSLTGTGSTASAPSASASPSPLSFGNQNVGTASSPRVIALNNSGTANLTVSSITASPSQFVVAAAPTLPLTLAPGNTTNIGVTFTPSAQGTVSGTLSIASNAVSSPTIVSLSGTGVQPAPSLVSITTSSLPTGTQQQTYSATLTATGGTAPYSWSISSGSLPSGLTLGASSGSITGTPTVSGSFTVTAQVKDAVGQTAQKALSLSIAAVSATPHFGHVAIVVEENANYSSVTTSSMPYLSALMSQYGLATQYYANTHPSIGNYLMLTTGQILTNNDSDTPSSFPVSANNVVRELLAAGKTWKAYAESLPSVGYLGGDTTSGGGQYYVRHVPLAYLTDVQNNSTQRQNLVPFTQFASDLAAANLPNYSFITPNGCDDAHDCSLSTADNWLKTNIDPLIKNAAFQKDGLLIVVFDESGSDNTNGGGRVVCTLISPAFSKLAHQSTSIYQHQDVLRLALEGLGVTGLPGAAATAPDMWEFFNTSGGTIPPPLAITTTSLPSGTVEQTYSTQLNATGGTSPYSWSTNAGALPAGLSLSTTGVISGTPTTAGSSTFTATVRGANSQTTSKSFTLTVSSLTATACTLYVSPAGSDANPGTLSAPWRTPQKAANSAAAGQTVCFRGGSYPQTVTNGYQQTFNNSGSQGNSIVFTNYPGEIAVIQGSTRINGSYLTFRGTPQGTGSCDAINPCGLVFEGSQGYNIDAIDICCATNSNSNFVLFDHVEIRKATYHAGLYQEGCNNAIVGSYVHDNGAFNANRAEDNGIYWSVTSPGCTNGGLIANNLVENNYSKGIQLYDGGSATSPAYVTVTENTSVNNGAQGAVVWGDHNVFVNNILYGNNNLSGGAAGGAQAALYTGSANLVDHNLTFDPTGNSGWYNPGGCCITNNKQADPLFVNPSGLDWHILTTSPAIGFSNLSHVQPVDKDNVSRGSAPNTGTYQQ